MELWHTVDQEQAMLSLESHMVCPSSDHMPLACSSWSLSQAVQSHGY